MLITILAIAAMSMGFSVGADTGSIASAWALLGGFCAVFIPLCAGGIVVDRHKNLGVRQTQLARRDQLNTIARKYNEVTKMLEDSYNDEKAKLQRRDYVKKEQLRQHYETLYYKNQSAFNHERLSYLRSPEAQLVKGKGFKRFWKWVVGIGLLVQMMACSYTFGINTGEGATAEASAEVTYWNADNIPMPHLEDASRYVANPDSVVSANTERLLNQWYKQLDDSLGIESVVVLVNHVENDDPFRMAQDIGNKYGVGREDRGLVVILAYEDHAIHISTGQSLEADLTDIECKRLQQEYVVPSMRAEQPDSGMLYLAEAVYNTLQKKDLPRTPLLSDGNTDNDEGDALAGIMGLYMVLFGGWLILIAYLYNRYEGSKGLGLFAANPFMKPTESHSAGSFGGFSSGGRSFGGGGGGGGFSGGSFGGGSFGGGGATSRW